VYITFRVWIKDWVSDGGAAFHKEASGCGAMTGWYFGDSTDKKQDGSGKNIGTYEAQHYASFRLPITFKPECVMRAIKSAGGPEGVKC
jgi:hypothetical protein